MQTQAPVGGLHDSSRFLSDTFRRALAPALLSLGVSLLLVLLSLIFTEPLLSLLGAEGALRAEVRRYLVFTFSAASASSAFTRPTSCSSWRGGIGSLWGFSCFSLPPARDWSCFLPPVSAWA